MFIINNFLNLLVDFIFDEDKIDLTRQLLPIIRVPRPIRKSILLYGPEEKCKKMVFMEFIKAETYYLRSAKVLKFLWYLSLRASGLPRFIKANLIFRIPQ